MKTKNQASNKKKKRPRAKKRVIIFDTHIKHYEGKQVYFRWGGSIEKTEEYPEKHFNVVDLITDEEVKIISLSGRSFMERCVEKQGIYIISVRKQKNGDRYIPNPLNPKMIKNYKLEYPEFLL